MQLYLDVLGQTMFKSETVLGATESAFHHPFEDEWSKQSDKDLLDIYTYMYDHAFDSPSPLKCE